MSLPRTSKPIDTAKGKAALKTVSKKPRTKLATKESSGHSPKSEPTPQGAGIGNRGDYDIEASMEVQRFERISLLAYSYWERRGCHQGSPDEDWYRAEQEIDRQSGLSAGR